MARDQEEDDDIDAAPPVTAKAIKREIHNVEFEKHNYPKKSFKVFSGIVC